VRAVESRNSGYLKSGNFAPYNYTGNISEPPIHYFGQSSSPLIPSGKLITLVVLHIRAQLISQYLGCEISVALMSSRRLIISDLLLCMSSRFVFRIS
jgi:hypothetical protein